MTLVLDSDVLVAGLLGKDSRHREAKLLLNGLVAGRIQAVEPLTVLVEVSGAVARQADEESARSASDLLLDCESVTWESVEEELAAEAARFARECRIRAGDAILAAVAFRNRLPLITYDGELRERTKERIAVHESWPP